jgi:hypothetical protein
MGTVDDRIDTIVRGKRGLIRTAIGSPDIMETPTSNVLSLLKQWSDHSSVPGEVSIREGDQLPPLPKAKEVQSIVFYGDRWTPKSAALWCKMNGYKVYKRVQLDGRFRLFCHPVAHFTDGKFSTVAVARDIRLIVGKRLSQANERRVKAAMIKAR